jgi:hypothetical protein
VDAPQAFYGDIPSMINDFNRFFIQILIVNVTHVIWEHDNDYTIFNYEQFHKQFSYVRVPVENKKTRSTEYVKATRIWIDSFEKRSMPYGGATIANDSLVVPLVPFQQFLRFDEKILLDTSINKN